MVTNLIDTTTLQTVAVSPMWAAASSGLRGAALIETAHRPNATDKGISFAAFIAGFRYRSLTMAKPREVTYRLASPGSEPPLKSRTLILVAMLIICFTG